MLERHMPETPTPPGTLSKIPGGEMPGASSASSERTEKLGLPENRTLQITGFNTLFKFYEEANHPLWERLKRGEELSDQERRDAIGYKITLDGIERLTAEPHRVGVQALPHTMPTDEFINTYKTPDGRIRKQREGLVTNHMTAWADREIAAGNEDRALHLSREVVWENSLPYVDLHTTPGSISLEDRIRQEAGAFIHDTGEGDEGRNAAGVKIRDSQHPVDSDEHALGDWVTAETEIGGREEYIIDPPLPTDAIVFVNPPRYKLDPDAEPRHLYIPDRVENGPVRQGRVRSRRPEEEIRQWIVDLRGGVIPVGPVNLTNDYRVPALRETGTGSVQPATISDVGRPADGTKALGSGSERPSGEAEDAEIEVKTRAERDDPLRDLVDKLKGTGWGREIRSRVKRFIPGLPNWKILLVPLAAGGIGLIPDKNANISISEAVRASEPAPLVSELPPGWRDEDVVHLPGGDAVRMPGNIYGFTDDSVAPTGPRLEEMPLKASPVINQEKPTVPTIDSKGKSDLNIVEIKYNSEGEHSIKGLVEDMMAQALNPNYKKYVESFRAEGKDTPPDGDFLNGTIATIKEELAGKYGNEKGAQIYDQAVKDLIVQMVDAIDIYGYDGQGRKLDIINNATTFRYDPSGNKLYTGGVVPVVQFDTASVNAAEFRGLDINNTVVNKTLASVANEGNEVDYTVDYKQDTN